MRMLHAIPALPVSDIERSTVFYRDTLGFTLVHQEAGFAIVERDGVQIHLWAATEESWRTRSRDAAPVVSGAESFIAGTARRGALRLGDVKYRVQQKNTT